MLAIPDLLATLARSRPVFHSEADFQFALAWAWQQHDPEAAVRLEYRLPGDVERRREYADLWVRDSSGSTYLELKYWTRSFDFVVREERFLLSSQGAQDLSRYDFAKDLARVDRTVAARHAERGGVIAVTNDPSYWNEPPRMVSERPPIDAAFRLHEGRVLDGDLAWSATAGGTTRGRSQTINLTGPYVCHWRTYSNLAASNGEFRYLFIPVGSRL